MKMPTHEQLKALRAQYPKGCGVKLNHMDDPYRLDLKEGAMGLSDTLMISEQFMFHGIADLH